MLAEFNELKIKKGQAYKEIKNHSFGVWYRDNEGDRLFTKKTVDLMYISWSFSSCMELYYNNILVKEINNGRNDFYGYGTCLNEKCHEINKVVKLYNLTSVSELEIRISIKPERSLFYVKNAKIKNIPNDWFYNYQSSADFMTILEPYNLEHSELKKYDLTKGFLEEKPIYIYSSFEHGFNFENSDYKNILNDFKKDKELKIAL